MLTQVMVRRENHEDVWWIVSTLAAVEKRIRDEQGRIWTIAEVYSEKSRYDLEFCESDRKRWAYVLGESDEHPNPYAGEVWAI